MSAFLQTTIVQSAGRPPGRPLRCSRSSAVSRRTPGGGPGRRRPRGAVPTTARAKHTRLGARGSIGSTRGTWRRTPCPPRRASHHCRWSTARCAASLTAHIKVGGIEPPAAILRHVGACTHCADGSEHDRVNRQVNVFGPAPRHLRRDEL